jgi:anthranilate synthase component I
MTIEPEFADFEKLVAGCAVRPNVAPIFATLPAAFLTPSAAYLKISKGSSHSFLFESIVGGTQLGRYSWVGANPYHIFESGPGREVEGDPLIELEKLLSKYTTMSIPGVPPMPG